MKNMSIGDVRPREEDEDENEDGPSISIRVNPSTSISNNQAQQIVHDSSNDDSRVQDQVGSLLHLPHQLKSPLFLQKFIMLLQRITPWIKSWVILVRVLKLNLA